MMYNDFAQVVRMIGHDAALLLWAIVENAQQQGGFYFLMPAKEFPLSRYRLNKAAEYLQGRGIIRRHRRGAFGTYHYTLLRMPEELKEFFNSHKDVYMSANELRDALTPPQGPAAQQKPLHSHKYDYVTLKNLGGDEGLSSSTNPPLEKWQTIEIQEDIYPPVDKNAQQYRPGSTDFCSACVLYSNTRVLLSSKEDNKLDSNNTQAAAKLAGSSAAQVQPASFQLEQQVMRQKKKKPAVQKITDRVEQMRAMKDYCLRYRRKAFNQLAALTGENPEDLYERFSFWWFKTAGREFDGTPAAKKWAWNTLAKWQKTKMAKQKAGEVEDFEDVTREMVQRWAMKHLYCEELSEEELVQKYKWRVRKLMELGIPGKELRWMPEFVASAWWWPDADWKVLWFVLDVKNYHYVRSTIVREYREKYQREPELPPLPEALKKYKP
ncbi:MAG: hypothetical protein KatS3mg031_2903 [Chitinophagales bacterium]|nr:MAG: hypothetical protein KatS3mg031_2903 [Chitinophagales bacterium]